MHFILASANPALWNNIGGILSGLAELLLAVGSGIAFLIRIKRNSRRERLRAESAASLAAQETRKNLEAKLEAQYNAQLEQYKNQMASQVDSAQGQAKAIDAAHQIQVEQLRAQIKNLQEVNSHLLDRILEDHNE